MIHVAVAVICQNNQCLIAKRASEKHQGGKWEFPGGKVEQDEPVTVALTREIREEINIDIELSSTRKLTDIRFAYDDIEVWLDCWLVKEFSGEPVGAEGQKIQWVDVNQLSDIDFPAANKEIIAALNVALAE